MLQMIDKPIVCWEVKKKSGEIDPWQKKQNKLFWVSTAAGVQMWW